MKKLLLINANIENLPYPVPPLGLSILAGILKNKYSVKIYDGIFNGESKLLHELETFNPDYIGISIRNIDDMVLGKTSYYVDRIFINFVEPVKKMTNAPVILGGSGFSIYPGELMTLYKADYGIIGEAEESFPKILEILDHGGDVTTVPGVITRELSPLKVTTWLNNYNLDKLPFSDIDDHIDFRPYLQRGVYSIQTKRGCNHRCVYCTYPGIEGEKYRFRKVEDIVEEIFQASIRLEGVNFEFVDSTFNDPSGWAESICKEIIRRNIKVNFRTMGINPANTSHELFKLMINAGFSQIDCTPDSASPEMLVNLGKNFTLDQLKTTARLLGELDLPTMWFFIFGGPGETEKTIEETFRFIDNFICEDDMVHITTGLRIYPGTPLHKIAVEEKQVDPNDSLLIPKFYIANSIGEERIKQVLSDAVKTRSNCIPAEETSPHEEMLKEALKLRAENRITEPMFRTLMRLRREKYFTSSYNHPASDKVKEVWD